MTTACVSGGARRIGGGPASDSATASALAAERGMQVASARTVAVPPFRLTAGDATLGPLGYAIADFVATDLARSARLQLVERARLGEVLRELELSSTGRLDSATAPRAGRILQAQQLLLGALDTLAGGDLRLSVRLADVQSGQVAQALDARAPRNDLLAAEKVIVFRLFEAMRITLSPAERRQIESRPSSSLEAMTAYGLGVEADLAGDSRLAAKEYQRAQRLDPLFRLAGERAVAARARTASTSATLIPGIRGIEAPVTDVVDRLNRPLDLITIQSRPIPGPGDPAFPTTVVTVVIIIKRP